MWGLALVVFVICAFRVGAPPQVASLQVRGVAKPGLLDTPGSKKSLGKWLMGCVCDFCLSLC